jgi:uncharacterized membrane protein YGL010W
VTNIDNWLTEYEKFHATVRNPLFHWTAIPMVIIGFSGLLWSLPVPAEFKDISALLNWGSAFLMVTAIYYFIISLSLAIGLLPFLLGLAAIQILLMNAGLPALEISIGLLAGGIISLILSRQGSALAIMRDLQLMMIGPAWLLSVLYKRFEIPI